jgi:hypothetical protein
VLEDGTAAFVLKDAAVCALLWISGKPQPCEENSHGPPPREENTNHISIWPATGFGKTA